MVAEGAPPSSEVGIVLTDDAEIRQLNQTYRNRDQATNVLSFAMEEGGRPPGSPPFSPLLGDVVLAYETLIREATDRAIPLKQHLTHLVIHGILHLLGHDHERSPEDAERQEARESAILAGMGMENPYG